MSLFVKLIIKEKEEEEKGALKMNKCNLDIRQKIKDAGFPLWFVADRIGIADTTFSKWLRKELPDDKKKQILKAIEELKRDIQQEENKKRRDNLHG